MHVYLFVLFQGNGVAYWPGHGVSVTSKFLMKPRPDDTTKFLKDRKAQYEEQRQRNFVPRWLKEFPWLHHLFQVPGIQQFRALGKANIQKTCLLSHGSSDRHKMNPSKFDAK